MIVSLGNCVNKSVQTDWWTMSVTDGWMTPLMTVPFQASWRCQLFVFVPVNLRTMTLLTYDKLLAKWAHCKQWDGRSPPNPNNYKASDILKWCSPLHIHLVLEYFHVGCGVNILRKILQLPLRIYHLIC